MSATPYHPFLRTAKNFPDAETEHPYHGISPEEAKAKELHPRPENPSQEELVAWLRDTNRASRLIVTRWSRVRDEETGEVFPVLSPDCSACQGGAA